MRGAGAASSLSWNWPDRSTSACGISASQVPDTAMRIKGLQAAESPEPLKTAYRVELKRALAIQLAQPQETYRRDIGVAPGPPRRPEMGHLLQ